MERPCSLLRVGSEDVIENPLIGKDQRNARSQIQRLLKRSRYRHHKNTSRRWATRRQGIILQRLCVLGSAAKSRTRVPIGYTVDDVRHIPTGALLRLISAERLAISQYIETR